MGTSAFTETHTLPGSGEGRVNEDYVLVCKPHCCAVLVDGATGLTKVNLVKGESDASWYSRTLAEQTIELLEDHELPTVDALRRAGEIVADEYLSMPGAKGLAREDLPNGSVSVLRWVGDEMEVCMLGDCTAAVVLRDGVVRVIHDPTLDELDKQNYERMYRYASDNGTTMAQARRAINDHFIENRLKMNEPGGYWAADVTCRGFGHELVERFPLGEVAGAFMCSDGYAAAVEMGVVRDIGDLARGVLAGDGPRIANELRAAEREDEGLWRVHRSKISDDATYAAVRFE